MKNVFGFTVKDIAEIAILCALAIILDRFIRIGIGSTGGSINISMVPLYIIALRHGWFKSFIAGGLVYGLITFLFDGYGFQTYPLEYFVAYGSVAILGLFATKINSFCQLNNKKSLLISYLLMIVSILIAAVIRFLCATIDSVLIWEYDLGAAFIYNAPYVFISSLGVCVIMCLLLPTIKVTNNSFPTSFLEQK